MNNITTSLLILSEISKTPDISHPKLAEIIHLHEDTVWYHLKKLKENGYIETSRGGRVKTLTLKGNLKLEYQIT